MPYFIITGITTTRLSRDPTHHRGDRLPSRADYSCYVPQENSSSHLARPPAVFLSLMTDFEEPNRSGAVERKKLARLLHRPTESRGPLFFGTTVACECLAATWESQSLYLGQSLICSPSNNCQGKYRRENSITFYHSKVLRTRTSNNIISLKQNTVKFELPAMSSM